MKTSRNSANDRRSQPIQALEFRRLMSLTAPFELPQAGQVAAAPTAIVHSFGHEASLDAAPDAQTADRDFEAQLIASIARGIALRSPGEMVTTAIVTTAYAQAEVVKFTRRKPNLFSSSILRMNPNMIPQA